MCKPKFKYHNTRMAEAIAESVHSELHRRILHAVLIDGWTYERECLEDEDEDGLFLVRTRVARGHGGEGNEKVYERLVWYSGSGSGGEGVR